MGYRWGKDGGEELRDGGLRWISGIAISFAGCRKVAAFACGGTGWREERDWGLGGIWGRNRVQWVLAVPYIPVKGSPRVVRES